MTPDAMERPRVRHLDVVPIDTDEGKAYLVRDPLELIPRGTGVPPLVLYLLGRMDGTRDAAALAAELTRETGAQATADQVRGLIRDLDERLFLEGERFDRALREKLETFRDAPHRPSILTGRDLPADPEALRRRLGEVVAANPEAENAPPASARGLVAPHIDVPRGARCYGLAYGWLQRLPRPDLVVLLGTSHNGATRPLIPTGKPFATPLGVVPVAEELLAALGDAFDGECWGQEFLHQDEHSLEFQVLFLQALHPDPPPILPLLTGPLPTGAEGSPGGHPEVERLVERLRTAVATHAFNPLIVAAADLAHVGPTFGAPQPVTAGELADLARADRASLARAVAGDAEGFWRHVAAEGNPRQVCGLSPIYLLLRLLEGREGALLGYDQAATPDGSQCVTVASLAY